MFWFVCVFYLGGGWGDFYCGCGRVGFGGVVDGAVVGSGVVVAGGRGWDRCAFCGFVGRGCGAGCVGWFLCDGGCAWFGGVCVDAWYHCWYRGRVVGGLVFGGIDACGGELDVVE